MLCIMSTINLSLPKNGNYIPPLMLPLLLSLEDSVIK